MSAPGHRTYLNIGSPNRGGFYMPEAKRTPSQAERARGPILPMATDYGRPGGLLAYGLSQLRRLSGAASLTRRNG